MPPKKARTADPRYHVFDRNIKFLYNIRLDKQKHPNGVYPIDSTMEIMSLDDFQKQLNYYSENDNAAVLSPMTADVAIINPHNTPWIIVCVNQKADAFTNIDYSQSQKEVTMNDFYCSRDFFDYIRDQVEKLDREEEDEKKTGLQTNGNDGTSEEEPSNGAKVPKESDETEGDSESSD